LTEPFGQDIFGHDDAMTIDGEFLRDIYRLIDWLRDSPEKMNQWLHRIELRSAS
jgi:hypothetical protein